MSKENVEVAQRLYDEVFNLRDVTAAREVLDADFEWWDREDDPFAGVHRGLEECVNHLAELDEVGYLQIEVEEVIDAGPSVIAGVRVHGRGQASGAPLEMHEVHVVALRDGKATR